MKKIRDIAYGTQAPERQLLDLYLPEGEVTDLFIYFHGGGLVNGGKGGEEAPRFLIPLMENYHTAVISATYRMYPKAVFPEFVQDAASVVAWAKEHICEHKNVQRIFVGGSSAGAWLTAMLAYAPEYLGAHGIKTTDIDGYVIDSAQMTSHFNVIKERGFDPKRIIVDDAAPIYFIHEHTAFPKILVLVSDNDMPCRYEQNLMFLKTLQMYGCPQERVSFKLLEGWKHTEYLNDENIFADMVYEFMNEG